MLKKKEDLIRFLPVNTEHRQKTNHELQMDLFKVLILEGNINQAVELTRKMNNPTLIEKMWYMAKSKGIDCRDSIQKCFKSEKKQQMFVIQT